MTSTPRIPDTGTHDKKEESGRISALIKERVSSQQLYAADPKFKKYTSQVEKCLNTFDSVHEWADFIAFLKQLLKTLQSYQHFKEIPRKLVVSKRLAQCLNPALPAGVHQRALDVYSHILAVIGSDGLKRDLHLWSSGLFPFFEYASTSVRPIVLNIYEVHYLPLQEGLRPAMKAFILALLPGLEEETGEFFDKVLGLLDRLSGTISPAFLFQNVWLVMLTTPAARLTALNFVSRRLPKMHPDEDITPIVGQDVGLMIRAFAAALEDENLLVRRAALDLLLQSLRIESRALKTAQVQDRIILMRAAVGVVLRRDLSLNRRFFTWVLSSAEQSPQMIEFFKKHSLDLLKSTLLEEMRPPLPDYAESRPFKIFVSLLDKWEIGGPLTEAIVYDAFIAIRRILEIQQEDSDDVLMTASTLYEAIEPHALWKDLLSRILSEIRSEGRSCEAIRMAVFVLRTFKHDEEVLTFHLPMVFAAILETTKSFLAEDPSRVSQEGVHGSILLLEELSKQIPPLALRQRPELTGNTLTAAETQGPSTFACTFYGIEPSNKVTSERTSASLPLVTAFDDFTQVSMIAARALITAGGNHERAQALLDRSLHIITRLVARFDSDLGVLNLTWVPDEWLSVMLETLESTTFVIVDRIVTAVVAIHQSQGLEPSISIDTRPLMSRMVNTLFKYLRPNRTAYHVRAVNLIWSLEDATLRPHVESIIAQNLMSPESRNIQEAYEAFGVLVLDPILYDLLDPSIRRVPSSSMLNGKELPIFLYERPFDQNYINHVLEILLSVIRFGGQGFVKTARSNGVRRTQNRELVDRVEKVLPAQAQATYMDVLLELLLRYLQSEPSTRFARSLGPWSNVIQATTIDLLQSLVARGEFDNVSIQTVESAVVGKLYATVHLVRLDLQNKLLHLLHSIVASSDVGTYHSGNPRDDPSDAQGTKDPSMEPPVPSYTINQLLIQTLVDGISIPTNRPVLQHWLDFILTTIPQFDRPFKPAIAPLNDCVCRQLQSALTDLIQASGSNDADTVDLASSTTDSEVLMFCNVLERLVLLSLDRPVGVNQPEDEMPEKGQQESSGLLGYMSNVFSSDNMSNLPEEHSAARSTGYRCLHEAVRTLYSLWVAMVWTAPVSLSPKDHTLVVIYNRSRTRCRRVLEHIFRAQSSEVLESIVDCWSKNCVTPLALQVWSRVLQLAREIMNNIRETKSQAFPILRCVVVMGDKLVQTFATEDRRVRKDIQDTFSKLLDTCLTIASRTSDQGTWIRRAPKESLTVNGRDSPIPRCILSTRLQIHAFLASSVIPDLRKLLFETDKVSTACSNIAYYVISPAMKGKQRPLDIDPAVLDIIRQMTRIQSALKAWRGPVVEALNDNRFFNSSPEAGSKWKDIIKALFDADRAAFAELMSKVATASSTTLFTNREYENLLRSLNLRRLSYALYAADKNHFLTQLPSIQEKLVDVLRNSPAPVIQSEVYLCVRVLLCRLSPHNLTSFWPVILTELSSLQYRLFDQAITSLPSDGSEELSLILSASKFLDLLLVLQTEEFQIHQWVFITDTVDAVFRPDNWTSEALVDILGEVAGDLPVAEVRICSTARHDFVQSSSQTNGSQSMISHPASTPLTEPRPMRRPMLNSIRQIDSIRDLVPFFSHVSIASYESMYASGGNVDWEAVERGLVEDMFDGR
ncbi:hypothetical protein GLOTRDRAFT_101965 [Gloeophyllum trabeum ATCC 11539]|uniref:Uncharacterized protein n=1 Tax=Gloeophyllum trabeum (strain ATCC 11539 / FP-39264 / Madison 617) TaxID=670483 RepID=S7QK49_GLOTA|nr:uncharacterized protein GLOTRDRAFT_101965 [Gloeophyllum trabeum ATCC 11539]EPQ60111.1 hypothetical protein GLOTRDRAFT_101965 [Gloeophyllum trabeum ATCC 11539]